MSLLFDGISFLQTDFAAIAIFAITILGLGLWLTRLLPGQVALRPWRLPLSLGSGCALLTLLALGLFMLARIWPWLATPGSLAIVLLALVAIAAELLGGKPVRKLTKPPLSIWLVAMGFMALLVIRLAFLRTLLLPPYHDSPLHYSIVDNFLSPGAAWSTDHSPLGPLKHYYHLGFHSLVAWLVAATGMEISSAFSLLGQLLLLLAPLTVMALGGILSGDRRVAMLAALFAAIGWRMPAFATNWGKYPAIAATTLLPIALGLMCLLVIFKRNRWAWLALAITAAAASLIHTRMAVVLLIACASILAAARFRPEKGLSLRISLLLVIPAAIVLFALREPLSQAYCENWCVPFGIVVALLPFAFQAFPQVSLGIFYFLLGIFLASQLKLPAGLGDYGEAFLDQTFLQIILYIPLAVLGGVGISGLIRRLPVSNQHVWGRGLVTVVAATLVFNFAAHAYLYPDPCCNYVKPDDLDAYRWIEANTVPDAVFIIPAYHSGNQMIGTDAGIWVNAITHRNANKRPFTMDWSADGTLEKICATPASETYVYSGDLMNSFPPEQLDKLGWLKPVFETDSTRIYRVSDCSVRAIQP